LLVLHLSLKLKNQCVRQTKKDVGSSMVLRNTDGYGQVWIKPESQLHQTGRAAQKSISHP
jgi:hypothetical protein